MIPPARVLYDEKADRRYYVDSTGWAYSDWRYVKKLKCGLGHRMYSVGSYVACEKCDKKVECKVVPFEENKTGR